MAARERPTRGARRGRDVKSGPVGADSIEVRYFAPEMSQEQVVSGLAAAASGMLLVLPILVTDLVMVRRVDWTLAGAGLLVAALPSVYIASRIRRATHGQVVVPPEIAFAATCCSSAALVLGDLATRPWSHDAYLAALVLPCLLVGIIGDGAMVGAMLAVTAAELAGCLAAGTLVVDLVLLWSVDALAITMVAPSIRRADRRFRSREAVAGVAATLAAADSVEHGLAACLPQVHRAVPCSAATVLARVRQGDEVRTRVVAEWSRGGIALPWDQPVALPAEADGLTRPEVTDRRCLIPLGHTAIGDLTVVLEPMPWHPLLPAFSSEAVAGLAANLVLGMSQLTHLSALRHESRTDPLTGLANRRALEEGLAVELERSARTGQPLAVAIIDLDHFKDYNDRYGHQTGDDLVVEVARTMRRRLRAVDLLARYGGEEFCAVLPGTTAEQAAATLDAVRRWRQPVGVARRRPSVTVGPAAVATATSERAAGGPTVAAAAGAPAVVPAAGEPTTAWPTASVGVAQWDGAEGPDRLLGRADQALYQAKAAGRDRVVAAEAPVASSGGQDPAWASTAPAAPAPDIARP